MICRKIMERVGLLILMSMAGTQGTDPCQPNPCLHGGDCEPIDEADFQCICKDGHTGKTCEILLTGASGPCYYNPCLNDGICEPVSEDDFQCKCKLDYGGKLCEFIVCHAGYNCEDKNPCLSIDVSPGDLFLHEDPRKYVQCDTSRRCLAVDCPSTQVFNPIFKRCEWPSTIAA